jgi:tetratricopeptide (TPR) repeat protein
MVKSLPLFLILSISGILGAKEPAPGSRYVQGILLEREGKYREALREFLLVSEKDAANSESYREMGNCFYYLGDKEKAAIAYSTYLATHPEAVELRKFTGQLAREIIHSKPKDSGNAKAPAETYVEAPVKTLVPERPWRHEYPEIGGSLGTPGFFNLMAGYEWEKLGVRLSGGGLNSRLWGAQGNLMLKVGEYRHLVHHVSLVGGLSEAGGPNNNDVVRHWNYGGVGYDINWYGAFAELCLTAGSGDYSGIQAGIQLGYMYRFNQ